MTYIKYDILLYSSLKENFVDTGQGVIKIHTIPENNLFQELFQVKFFVRQTAYEYSMCTLIVSFINVKRVKKLYGFISELKLRCIFCSEDIYRACSVLLRKVKEWP